MSPVASWPLLIAARRDPGTPSRVLQALQAKVLYDTITADPQMSPGTVWCLGSRVSGVIHRVDLVERRAVLGVKVTLSLRMDGREVRTAEDPVVIVGAPVHDAASEADLPTRVRMIVAQAALR